MRISFLFASCRPTQPRRDAAGAGIGPPLLALLLQLLLSPLVLLWIGNLIIRK